MGCRNYSIGFSCWCWNLFYFLSLSPKSSECTKAGEYSFINPPTKPYLECCAGLDEVGGLPDGTPEECADFANMEGYGSICTNCGNNICEDWENRCICPADCS